MTGEGGRLREAADRLEARYAHLDGRQHRWEPGSTASHRLDCPACLVAEGAAIAGLLRAVSDELMPAKPTATAALRVAAAILVEQS